MELDIPSISAVVAAIGVLIGVVFTALQLRDLVKTRQSDLLMRMHLVFSSREYCDAALKMLSTNYKDYDDFIEKYGRPFAEGPVQTEFLMMWMFFEGIGILTYRKLVDIRLVADLFAVEPIWEKSKPLVEALRRKTNNPHIGEWTEYLSNETRKIQRQTSITA